MTKLSRLSDDECGFSARAVRCWAAWSRDVITGWRASLVTKLQGYTEGYYQLAIYALIAGLLLIVVSPLIRKLMQEVTNINQILLYVYNNYRRSLKQKSFGHPVGLFILFHRNVERFSYYGMRALFCTWPRQR
jgi:dipeptide/tripeptide permease